MDNVMLAHSTDGIRLKASGSRRGARQIVGRELGENDIDKLQSVGDPRERHLRAPRTRCINWSSEAQASKRCIAYALLLACLRVGAPLQNLATAEKSQGLSEAPMLGRNHSEMACYGSRLDCPKGNFLLYNGNAYGKDGFGAAPIG
jgi:hypothetical protein